MDQITRLISLIERYCEVTGIAEATLSSRVFRDGKRVSAIRAGSDVGVRRMSMAVQWFSDNWPGSADWPDGVPRPEPIMAKEAAE